MLSRWVSFGRVQVGLAIHLHPTPSDDPTSLFVLDDSDTPSTNGITHSCNQYDIMLFIPGAPGGQGCLVEAVGVIETTLAAQGIDGLIGRDLLDRWTCVYNGSAGIFTICY